MKHDIRLMLTCDAVLMLPNWNISHGARFENFTALVCGMRVFYSKLELPIHQLLPRA